MRLNNAKLCISVHYEVLSVLSIPWEIYCHQMNFRFWNYNRFETGIINFVGHGLPANFTFFPQVGIMEFFGNWTIISILHTTRIMLVFFRFMQTVWIRAFKLLKYSPTGTRQNRMLFLLFFSSGVSSLMRTKQYRLQNRYSFNFNLRRGLSPPTIPLGFWGKSQIFCTCKVLETLFTFCLQMSICLYKWRLLKK